MVTRRLYCWAFGELNNLIVYDLNTAHEQLGLVGCWYVDCLCNYFLYYLLIKFASGSDRSKCR